MWLTVCHVASWLKNRIGIWIAARRNPLALLICATVLVIVFYTTNVDWLKFSSAALALGALGLIFIAVMNDRNYSLEHFPISETDARSAAPAHWSIISRHGRHAAFSLDINRALHGTPVRVRVEPNAYKLTSAVLPYRNLIFTKRKLRIVSNDQKVGQATDLSPEMLTSADNAVTVYQTDYYNSLFTNDLAERKLNYSMKAHRRVHIDGARFFLEANGRLASLEARRASNHIGVSTIAIFDGLEIPLSIQSSRSVQNPGQIVPSGTGSVDWTDQKSIDGKLFASVLIEAMERELLEELGLASSIKRRSVLVGFCRVLHRGGKPDYFGLTRVSAPISMVRRTLFERLFLEGHIGIDEVTGPEMTSLGVTGTSDLLLRKFDRLVAASVLNPRISIMTELNAMFASDFIRQNSKDTDLLLN